MEKKQAVSAAKTAISAVTGWTILKQVAGVVVETGAAAGRIGGMLRRLLVRKTPRTETFADAVARLRLTDADLQARQRDFHFYSALSFLAAVVGFGFLVFAPMSEHPLSHALLSAGLIAVAGARTLSWHFRACQVRDRALFGFGEWLVADPWVRRAAIGLAAFLVLVLLLFATTARAAESSSNVLHLFSPPVGDASVTFLREIFGSVVDLLASGGDARSAEMDSPLGQMLVPFNSAVLFIGMLFVGWTTIKGTVNSAHDGELLGRKMSEVWVPIRTVGGTALILPLSAGYSTLQIAVLWLSLQSAGIADTVLGGFLDYAAETNMVARPNLPDPRQLAASVFKFEVCAAAMNKQYADSGWTTRIVPEEKSWIVANTGEIGLGNAAFGAVGLAKGLYDATYTVTEYHWRAMDNGKPAFLSPDVCGALTWEQSHESSEGNSNTSIVKQTIANAQMAATRAMIAELRPVAQQVVAFQPPPPGAIETAAANYEKALTQAAKAVVQQSPEKGRTEFIEAVRAGGWIYLPTYYNHLIQMNDVMQGALNALPATSPVAIEDKATAEVLQNYRDAMIVANEYLKARADAPRQELLRQANQDKEFPTSWSDLKRFLAFPAQKGIYEFTQQLAGSNLSHVGQIKAVGDTITGTAEAIAMAAFAAQGLASSNAAKLTVGNVFDAGAALTSINPMIMSIVISLLIFGAIAAHWIPLIPYVTGISAVIKWFVLVFESVIAAPIWAVAHIHPDGDDTVGKAGPGYMMVLGLLLRPVLTVFGFFGSIWLAQPITGYINNSYMTAVQGAEHNSFTFLTAFVAYVIIYVVIMTGVIHSIFTLVNWLPDNVLRWIGGALNAHGIGDSEVKEAEHTNRAAVVSTVRGGGHGGGGGNPRQAGHQESQGGTAAKAGPTTNELIGGNQSAD